MPAIAERPPMEIRRTATATGSDSESLFRLRQDVWASFNTPISRHLTSASQVQEEETPLGIEADFSSPRSKQLMADEQRSFMATVTEPFYDIDLPEED